MGRVKKIVLKQLGNFRPQYQFSTEAPEQCDRIGRFIELWATFQSLWQQLHLPKSLKFLGNFCKGVKIFNFSSEISSGQLLQTFGDFLLVTLLQSSNASFKPYNFCCRHKASDKVKVLLVLPDKMFLIAIPIIFYKLQSGMKTVGPDWTFFASSWQQIFFQKGATCLVTFGAFQKTITSQVKLEWLIFGQLLKKIWTTFYIIIWSHCMKLIFLNSNQPL